MKTPVNPCIQWAILSALVLVGFMAFLVMCGDDDPFNPMPLGQFLFIKAVALAVFGCCVWIGKICNKKGLLPEMEEE